jgi:hypothetical protein
MKKVLTVAAVAEAATGVALIVVPSLAGGELPVARWQRKLP